MYNLVTKPKIAVAYCFFFIALRALKLSVIAHIPKLNKNDNIHIFYDTLLDMIKQKMVPKAAQTLLNPDYFKKLYLTANQTSMVSIVPLGSYLSYPSHCNSPTGASLSHRK